MDFTQALDTSATDFEPPKLIPEGVYTMAVTKQYDLRSTDDWDIVNIPCKIVSATEDVDPDEIEEYGSVSNAPMRKTFMFPKDPDEKNSWARTMENLKRFVITHCQAEVDESATLGELLAATVNCQFLGEVGHRPDKRDPAIVYAELGKTAPLD